MRQSRLLLNMSAVAILGATTFGIGASVTSRPSLMSDRDYEGLRVAMTIEAEDGMAMCNSFHGNGRVLCQTEVRADLRTQLADLDMRFLGTYEAAREARLVRIRAAYEKARARCFGMSGYDRDSCIVSAHAEKARSLVVARVDS